MSWSVQPANIVIDEQGEPHILDFGLARAALTRHTEGPNPEPITPEEERLGPNGRPDDRGRPPRPR